VISPGKAAMIAIGIDVGGTQTRVGAVDDGDRIVAIRRCETVRDADGSALVDRLVRTIDEVLSDSRDERDVAVPIGMALPGLLDRDRRLVVRSVSLPCLEGKPIADELTQQTAHPVYLATDAEAATWGEYTARSPRPRDFVHLRLGTGIGCGAVVNGELQRLDLDRSGHLDELVIDDGPRAEDAPWRAPTCPCGKRGCLETVASGPALSQRTMRSGFAERVSDCVQLSTADQSPERKRRGERPRARAWGSDKNVRYALDHLLRLQLAWEQGDPSARALVDETSRTIAIALGNLARRFNPEVICIGGGVAEACPCLVDEAKRCFAEIKTASVVRCPIEPAILGDDAGILGAALLARDAFSAHQHAPMVNP